MLRIGLRQHSRAFHYKRDCLLGCHSWQPGAAAAAARHVPATAAGLTQQQHGGCRHKHEVAANAASGYWTLAEPYTLETEIKKSQFVATAWPVTSAAEALSHIADASDPTASHNCWAFRVAGTARSNDDGEPGGTAGKPILGAIEGDGLDGVCVLVVRYFGGVKLGAGGLVRAYGAAARDCIRAAPKAFVKAKVQLAVVTPFDCLGTVYNMLAKHGAAAGEEEYQTNGKVKLLLTADADQAAALQRAIADATSGKVQPKLVVVDDDS